MSSDTWLPDVWSPVQASAAAEARSMLACPETTSLHVDGIEDPIEADDLSVIDDCGTPVLLTVADSVLDGAAIRGARARLVVHSPLAEPDDAPGALELVGHLHRHHGCARGQVVVTVVVDHVLLHSSRGDRPTVAIEPDLFTRPELRLNRGYLERSAQHANEAHQAELCRSIATVTGTRLHAVAGVRLEQVTPSGVVLTWVDTSGAHRTEITFDRVARSPEELASLLSDHLHPDLC